MQNKILQAVLENRYELYREYIQALGMPRMLESELRELVDKMSILPCYKWIPIQDENGFLIIGTAPECHPDCDYFIVETFLRKEFRGKSIMADAVKRFVKSHKGTYCLWILDKNHYAKKFWHHIFTDVGYRLKDLKVIPNTFDQSICKQYGYEPDTVKE